MDVVTSSYLPGDPRLIDQIVYELKSQGIFDQFRKECIADVDTKPAYQNLSQRVEGSVMNFLKKQKFSEDMNKNQLREQLRKNISESGFLETGVERIVDQVVNPKINTIFLPKVEDVVYRFLGLEKPNEKPNQEVKEEENAVVEDLLPNDLEAISPESVHDNSFNSNVEKKDDSIETNENSLNSSNTKTEDESPPFELLEENTKFSVHEENSVDSHLSGISGLASHDSVNSTEMKDINQMDVSQDNSQNSLNSEGNLSIVTSEGETNMDICEDSDYSDNKEVKKENNSDKVNDVYQTKEKAVNLSELNNKETVSEKYEEKTEEIKNEVKTEEIKNEVKTENKKEVEDKKSSENKDDSKKNNDKHKSSRSNKDRKDEKDKRSRSKSESKSKDHRESKSSSKHSSSSSKDRDKDKKEHKNGKDKEENSEKDRQVKKEDKDRDRNKEKRSKSKEKQKNEKDRSDKDKDKVTKDKDRSDKDKDKSEKEKTSKDKSSKDKEKQDKEKSRSEKEKSKSDRERDKVDKDKPDKDKSERDRSSSSKHGKEKSSSSSKSSSGSSKDKEKNDEKPKDKNSSSKDKTSSSTKHKESSNKEKESSKSSKDKDKSKSSSSSSKDKDRKDGGDSKSKSSDKHKKSDKDKSSHNEKNSSSSKKDKERKVIDDHYSLKDKRGERRSTDRDSNDGSSKMSRNGSFTESYSQSYKGSSKASSEVFSSGSGDSSNSDKMEEEPTSYSINGVDEVHVEAPQIIKYIKPKFASNIHEAMKIMKIRKQLAKLERQNQLSLSNVQMIKDDHVEPKAEPEVEPNLKELSVVLEKSPEKFYLSNNKLNAMNNKENIKTSVENKCNEQKIVLSDEQQAKGQEMESSIIDSNKKVEKEATKETKQNSKELVIEEQPIFKSHDLSMENFEALEARLAQEMSKVNYHMYGEEDDTYEYPSISLSPIKKRKASVEESKPALKKVLFESSNSNTEKDEVELVVNKPYTVFIEETGAIHNDVNIPTSNSELLAVSLCEEAVVTEQIEIINENTSIMSNDNSNIIIDNEGEFVIDDTQEEYVDYIQETIIDDIVDGEYDNVIVENKNGELEQFVKCTQDTALLQNEFEIRNEDMESVKLDVSHHKDVEQKNIETEFSCDNDDEFRGFDVIHKDDSKTVRFTERISDMEKALDRLTNIINLYVTKKNISGIPKMRNAKTDCPRKEDKIMLKRDLTLEATIKEMTNMSSTIQDLLQKNGKKLFIKMDKLDSKLPSKVVVSFQGLDSKENVCKINYEDNIKTREEIQGKIKVYIEDNKKDQICREQSNINAVILSPKSNDKGLMPANDLKEINTKWEDDDSPCYYFDNCNSQNEKHLKILSDMIGRLEKAVEKRSLQIQNNIPTVKKRGRKRKVQNTDNILNDPSTEPKRRHLSDEVSKHNGEDLCSNSLTLILDVAHNQSFNLPLSPAESEKSDEHKKEELITVKPKRSGRVSTNKRYSSEDLYKPRPVLSCTSSRRRGIKLEAHKP